MTFVVGGSIGVPMELVGRSNQNASLKQMVMANQSTPAFPAEQLHRTTEVRKKSSHPRRLECKDSTEAKVKQTQAKEIKQAKACWLKCVPMCISHVCVTGVHPMCASHVCIGQGSRPEIWTSFWSVLGLKI